MRSVLVDWLVDVCEEFRLSSQTLHITIACVDRYLSKKNVPKNRLQLVGITCILIASKYEEMYPPSIERLVFICDKIYNRNDILSMEKYVLEVLNFSFSNPTIKDFLRRFMNASGSDKVETLLANVVEKGRKFILLISFLKLTKKKKYLCELSLFEYNFILLPPSLIAASSIYLARLTLNRKPWNTTLEHYSQYSESLPQFKSCIKELYLVHKNASTSEFRAVQKRYSQEALEKVSSIEPVENFEI